MSLAWAPKGRPIRGCRRCCSKIWSIDGFCSRNSVRGWPRVAMRSAARRSASLDHTTYTWIHPSVSQVFEELYSSSASCSSARSGLRISPQPRFRHCCLQGGVRSDILAKSPRKSHEAKPKRRPRILLRVGSSLQTCQPGAEKILMVLVRET